MSMLSTYLAKRKSKKLSKQLDEMLDTAARRRSGSQDRYRRFHDFFNEEEERRFARLAIRHRDLSTKTGEEPFKYFDAKKHAVLNDPNSPIGVLTVNEDHSSTVTFKYDVEHDAYLMYRDGELQDPMTTAISRPQWEADLIASVEATKKMLAEREENLKKIENMVAEQDAGRVIREDKENK